MKETEAGSSMKLSTAPYAGPCRGPIVMAAILLFRRRRHLVEFRDIERYTVPGVVIGAAHRNTDHTRASGTCPVPDDRWQTAILTGSPVIS
jgi:hypothetical protein